jgi:protein-L-isoaspartate(D-aspartate) O-methyltransferase
MTNTTIEPDEATRLRNRVVNELCADGTISTPAIKAAMRKVSRHAFIPDTPLDMAYATYAAVITKTDEYGVHLSSVSAPQIQAMMLEQAQVRPGMRVLEIGSGGLNAAYLAELVGEDGGVVTVDIDPVVTDRASRLLEEQGYGKVRVVTADAAEPIPGLGEVDVVMVTAGAWDIAPAWTAQLKQGGRLVLPLRMRGLTRSIAFTEVTGENGTYLQSESARICGFVPMQGSTAHREELLLVNGTPEIGLKFDDGLPADPHRLDNAVTTPRHELWTGVTVRPQELIDTLQMAMAISLPGFCTMAVDKILDTGLVAPVNKRFALAPSKATPSHISSPAAPRTTSTSSTACTLSGRTRRSSPTRSPTCCATGRPTGAAAPVRSSGSIRQVPPITTSRPTGSSTRYTAGSRSPGPRRNAGATPPRRNHA